MPAEEFNVVLSKAREEHYSAAEPVERRPRLLVYGSVIDDASIIRLLEDCGANVVVDDTCFGTKTNWVDVRLDMEPLDSLAHH